MRGTTESGFKFNIDEKLLNNMELVEAIAELDTNQLALPRVLDLLIGKEQKKALYDHVRQGDIVPVDKVAEEVRNIFTAMGEKSKN